MRKTILAAVAALGLVVATGAAHAAIVIPQCGWVMTEFGPAYLCD